MHLDEIREFCLALAEVTEGFPFGESTLVFKVCGKMFALVSLDTEIPNMNLKCEPERAIELRELYPEITPGFHMNKSQWNTLVLNGNLPQKLVKELILLSYGLVVEKLPKKDRIRLLNV